MRLTVIFRDDSPMIYCGDSPSYRSVQIELTKEQILALVPMKTGHSQGGGEYEFISRCFLEPPLLSQKEKP